MMFGVMSDPTNADKDTHTSLYWTIINKVKSTAFTVTVGVSGVFGTQM